MEEKNIEAVPVYMEKGKPRQAKLSADYQAFVKAGPWADGGELRTQTYLKAKVKENYEPVSLAVKMPETQAAQVKAVTAEPKGYPYRKYLDKESGWVYFLPRGIHGQFKTGGKTTIQIRFADDRTESMTLFVRGTEEEEDFYQELILDLISMDQQLAMDQKSAMSMAKDWSKHLYEQTKMQIQTFYDAFFALEKKARQELKPFRTKQPFHKIKKITPKALIEHEIFHKEKVSAVSYREDFDTFEHRVIKTHLGRLKKLVKIRREMEISALETEQARLRHRLHFSEEELEGRIKNLEDRLKEEEQEERKKWEYNMDMNRKFPAAPLQENVAVQFHTSPAEKGKTDILKFEMGKCKGARPYIQVGNAEGYRITAPLDCEEAAAALFHVFQSGGEAEGGEVCICGDIVDTKGYYKEKFDFRKITKINVFLVEQQSPKAIERMKEEMYAYILGTLFEQFYSGGNDLENLGFYRAERDRGKLLKDLDQQILDLKKKKDNWSNLEKMLAQIDKSSLMKATKPVRTPIRPSNLFSFHPAYQKMYAVMLADNRKMASVDYYAKDRDDEFSVAKLSDLYEIWCCLKLAQIFIQNYEFQLLNIQNLEEGTGTDNLAEYIREILSSGKINGSRFDLQGKVKGKTMDVTLCYDRKIYDSQGIKHLNPDFTLEMRTGDQIKRFVLDAKYKGKHTGTLSGKKSVWRKVSYEDGLPDFCDACEVQCYDGIQELCEAAFDKYTRRFVQEIGVQAFDGSFIIHSCTDTVGPKKITPENDSEVAVTYNPKNYLGAYSDALAQQLWKKKCEENQWNVDVNRLLEWTGWFNGENNHENRLGVLTANPKENYLPNLLQMIMERHFEAYQERCWLCGSKNLQIEEGLTESGFPKYHITCKNPECKSFMVETHCADSKCHGKLGKHLDNYLAQKKGAEDAHWNVVCPKCRKRLPTRKNGSEATFQKIAPLPARDFSPPPWEPFRGRGS